MSEGVSGKAVAGFIGSPIGGFIIAIAVWQLFKQPCDEHVGTLTLHKECLAGMDFKSAMAWLAGGITIFGWIVTAVVEL